MSANHPPPISPPILGSPNKSENMHTHANAYNVFNLVGEQSNGFKVLDHNAKLLQCRTKDVRPYAPRRKINAEAHMNGSSTGKETGYD
jgi:hypothetical protein